MADVLILLAAAVLIMGGGVATALIARNGRRRQAQIRRDAPRRLRQDIRATGDYIKQINDALSEEDLDSLDRKRNEES